MGRGPQGTRPGVCRLAGGGGAGCTEGRGQGGAWLHERHWPGRHRGRGRRRAPARPRPRLPLSPGFGVEMRETRARSFHNLQPSVTVRLPEGRAVPGGEGRESRAWGWGDSPGPRGPSERGKGVSAVRAGGRCRCTRGPAAPHAPARVWEPPRQSRARVGVGNRLAKRRAGSGTSG